MSKTKIILKRLLKFLLGGNTEHVKSFLRKIEALYILPLIHNIYIYKLRKKKEINVVFIAASLSMWRYQQIYELLSTYHRFNVSIVLLPCRTYSMEQQSEDINKLQSYFLSKGINCINGTNKGFNIETELSPDILFYPQSYIGFYDIINDYPKFKFKLLCYNPYAFWTATGDWSYNLPLHNYAWKLFYSTELHLKDAQFYAYNKGRNVEVVGYPNADVFLNESHKDVWKKQNKQKKRIIWAPHYTIFPGGWLEQSNFLWVADLMLNIAVEYVDSVQFAFKPHPKLRSELYKHPQWGKEKTDKYYNAWETMGNTQLETGEFVDLFMTSDAMIHDSASFSVEYHYTSNPVLYIAKDFERQLSEKGEFGKLALLQHYVAISEEDIKNFIDNVVLKGDDPMKPDREEFYKEYLLPPNGKSVAENTLDVFLKTFC